MGDTTKTNPQVRPLARSVEEDERVELLPIGTRVGDHVIRALMARGGHGAVYEAEHCILGRRDAIKVLHRHLIGHGEMFQRFLREAQVVNQIRHPDIVDIHGYGLLENGSPYFVMELLRGTNLTAMLRARGRIPAVRALAYLEPVCAALAATHRAGVVHRDLKGSNIMVVEDLEVPRVKLLDFGIAKLLTMDFPRQPLTSAGQRLGTPHAMAPEQIRGAQVDQRTDVYALGVLLYHLLTARYPFESGGGLDVEWLHLSAPPPRPSLRAPVSSAIDAVVLRCLEKDPERRFPDVCTFIEALREAVGAPAAEHKSPVSARVKAVAIHAEVEVEESAHEDGAVLEEIADLLDSVERDLLAGGFTLALQTGTSLLGFRVLPDDTTQAGQELDATTALVRDLHRRTAVQHGARRVKLYLCVGVDQAEVRRTASGPELVGGPIARVAEWARRDPSGLCESWHWEQ